jgi:hypothetical protein
MHFVFDKINSLYTTSFTVGPMITLLPKNDFSKMVFRGSISAGPVLGILKPYYLELFVPSTVNPNTGLVTGVGAGGSSVISYTYPTATTCPATYNITVNAVLPITGVGVSSNMQVLIVAGGGGGGSDMGGGGGGGGVIYNPTFNVQASSTPYTIVVGAGGAGTPNGTNNPRGTNGSNSTFNGLTAIGGGGGASTGPACSFCICLSISDISASVKRRTFLLIHTCE